MFVNLAVFPNLTGAIALNGLVNNFLLVTKLSFLSETTPLNQTP